jgi:integrase
MSEKYKIQRLRGEFALVYFDAAGKRHRHALGTSDPIKAANIAPAIFVELTRPRDKSVKTLWEGYVADKAGRAIVGSMEHTWKALERRFGSRDGDAITIADCRAHVEARRTAGIKDWTIYTELGHLRNVLSWAEKHGHLPRGTASYIERPPQPKTEKRRLTREEIRALIEAAEYPHIRLYAILIYITAARTGALLDLIWPRCDFDRNLIDLRNPSIKTRHKGRAIVPMTNMARKALLEAQQYARSDHVIEWAGKPVKKVKRGLAMAAKRADLGPVNPHMLRHAAATHMAEDGVPMEEIQQYLGHSDISTTREIYARFSPDYLRRAAQALDFEMEKKA